MPGKPKWYATSVRFTGYLQPVLGKSIAGRPVKLEGNDRHPATGGATDLFMQAALLGLYDPDRSQVPLHLAQPATWAAFDTDVFRRTAEIDRTQGQGFRLLTGAVSSPTLLRQIGDMQKRWPTHALARDEPITRTSGSKRRAAYSGARCRRCRISPPRRRLSASTTISSAPGRARRCRRAPGRSASHGSSWLSRRRRRPAHGLGSA